MNYESGMANVTLIPSGNEFNVYIRSLEEISLNSTPQNFLQYSNNYFDFFKIISKFSDEENIKNGFFNNRIIEHERVTDYIWSIKTSENSMRINLFGNSIRDTLDCDCFSWKTDSSKLCAHLVSALDFVVREEHFLDDTWGTNNFNSMINTIFSELAYDCLDVLLLDLPENKHIFLKKFFEFKLAL